MKIYKMILIVADISIIFFVYVLSLLLKFNGIIDVVAHQYTTFVFLLLLTPTIFYFFDLYNHLYYIQRLRIFSRIIKAWFTILLLYVVIGFISKHYFLIESRAFVVIFFSLLLFVLFVVRLVFVKILLEVYFSNQSHKILCRYKGPSESFEMFNSFFNKHRITGLALVKAGGDLQDECKETFLFSDANSLSKIYQEIKSNLLPGRKLHVVSNLFNELDLNWEWCNFGPFLVFSLHRKKNQSLRSLVCRLIDIIGSIAGLIVFSPIFAVIAVAVKLDSPGPVIYKQKRCGKDGKEFIFYKFRSMYDRNPDDDEHKVEFDGFIEKRIPKELTINSEEITNIGRILRRTSFDELPQFINILKGEMSLIGPRPHRPYEVKCYKDWHKDRLSVKQGMSGIWQIYGRGELPSDKSIFLDLMYVINRSITLDVKLLFQTIPATISGKGAF
jgi:lipopolysaccharide/colanic/teichoic acid biosynthesis glycosyltransferase